MIQPLGRVVWRFLKILGVNLPYDSANRLLGIYLEKATILKGTCTPMFIAALITIARTWEQSRRPLTGEQIKKFWYIYIQWNLTQP